jgi:hypothetical protein
MVPHWTGCPHPQPLRGTTLGGGHSGSASPARSRYFTENVAAPLFQVYIVPQPDEKTPIFTV